VVELAIVGGGPGGLMMAHLLERFSAGLFNVTLFEATPRLGGKVLTRRFDTIPAIYEAGVAELYDYSVCSGILVGPLAIASPPL
jgi:protoporphyrinogen oxidase